MNPEQQPVNQAPQSQPQPMAAATSPQYASAPAANPGQTLGIIGIVLGILGISPVGLVLSILSMMKSGKVGASKVLGIVGLILNILSFIAGIFLFFVIVLAAQQGVQTKASASAAQVNANHVLSKAEAYYALHTTYPDTISDFSKNTETTIDSTITVTSDTPTTAKTIKYQKCDNFGAQITYYNPTTERIVILPAGDASTIPNCG